MLRNVETVEPRGETGFNIEPARRGTRSRDDRASPSSILRKTPDEACEKARNGIRSLRDDDHSSQPATRHLLNIWREKIRAEAVMTDILNGLVELISLLLAAGEVRKTQQMSLAQGATATSKNAPG
jgi:hypothetical protein